MKHLFLILVFVLQPNLFGQTNEVAGRIIADGIPISGAHVYLENTQKGTVTNDEGEYLLKNIPEGEHLLVIKAVSFKTIRKKINIKKDDHLKENFALETSVSDLDEIILVDEQTGLTRRTPYNVSVINLNQIQTKGSPNGIMGVLREVPGVYGAEFGQGIVKPFIRGLGFSRIVTIYQGNKLENHQWGADHGLGINDLGIKRVNIIKGPASVLYGSGALGGVLLSSDDDYYLKSNKLTGNSGITYNSVSRGIRPYLSLGKTFENNIFLALDAAYETHADYKDGDGRLIGNSRFNTQTFRVHTGIEKPRFKNKISFTYNLQNLGIIIDEEMQEDKSLATSRSDRDMQLPFQEIEEFLISYNQTTSNRYFETSLHLSHHYNDRKEIEESFSFIDLGLQQNHTFYNGRVTFSTKEFKHNLGVQGSFVNTRNNENAREFLIPDAQMFENGLYYLGSLDVGKYFLQAALRYDYRQLTANAGSENLVEANFILPGDPENKKLTRNFDGFTGSLGVTRKFHETSTLKLNVSTGFRAPDLAELFSNGPHPGTSRFEKGNDNFGREQSIQVDLGYTFRKNRFMFGISPFANQINNYIFFAASNKTSPQEDLELWTYQQTNARMYGFEFEISHHWLLDNRLETSFSGAIVRAKDTENNRNLTFIPPDNFNVEISYYTLKDKSLHLFSDFRIVADQNKVGIIEDQTTGYALLNIGANKEFTLGNSNFDAGITIHNLLNKTYVDHMSILRAFNVSSPGRNFMLNLNYKF